MKLSIIIPVYNVEKYLEDCIRSCYSQDLDEKEYEIVLVNDGSKDNSLDIAQTTSKGHSNTKIISQKNAGLSAARNKGMDNAEGDYYMFLDSDDWIAENCLSDIIRRLNQDSPDALSICAADFIEGKAKRRQKYANEGITTGKELLKKRVQVCAPFSIWSASFLKKNNLRFYEGIYHEDEEFSPRAYYLAEKISITNNIVYYIRQNPNSITRTFNPKKSFDLIEVVCPHLLTFSNCVDEKYKVIYYNKVGALVGGAYRNIIGTSVDNQKKLCDAVTNSGLLDTMKKCSLYRFRLLSFLCLNFPEHQLLSYKFVKSLLWLPVQIKAIIRYVRN